MIISGYKPSEVLTLKRSRSNPSFFCFFAKNQQGGLDEYHYCIWNGHTYGGVEDSASDNMQVISNSALIANSWYWVGFTFDGTTGTFRTYLNGTLDNSFSLAFNLPPRNVCFCNPMMVCICLSFFLSLTYCLIIFM